MEKGCSYRKRGRKRWEGSSGTQQRATYLSWHTMFSMIKHWKNLWRSWQLPIPHVAPVHPQVTTFTASGTFHKSWTWPAWTGIFLPLFNLTYLYIYIFYVSVVTYIFASGTSFLFYSFTRRFAGHWMVWGQRCIQCVSAWLSRAKTAVKNHSWFLNDLLKTASSKFFSPPGELQHPCSAQQVAFLLFSLSIPLGSVPKCWSLISLADLLLPICQLSFVYRQCI